MNPEQDIRFDRIDPNAGRYRLLPIRNRDGKVFRASIGDTYAVVEPGDERLRIAYIESGGEYRMKHLLNALVDRVGCHDLRFVSPRTSDDPIERAWQEATDAGPPLDEVLYDYEVVEEPWPEDAPEDDDVARCFDVEWAPND